MSRYIISILVIAAIAGCSVKKDITSAGAEDQKTQDSSLYELIVFENGYYNWLHSEARPIWYHTHEYYSHWNYLYSTEWNQRVRSIHYGAPYDYYIEYDPHIDYGKELDYKLYWFFRFMEDKYGIRLHMASR